MAISKSNQDKFERKVYNAYLKLQAKRVNNKPLYRFAAITEMLSEKFDRTTKTIEKILRKY